MSKFNENDIRSFLHNYLSNKLNDAGLQGTPLTESDSFLTYGLLDSMGFFELIAEIEERYDIVLEFGEQDPKEFTSINGLVKLILLQI